MSNEIVPSASAPATPVEVIEQLRYGGSRLHAELERQVHVQRLCHASWASIGKLLGVSRQAARKRWGYLDDLGEPEFHHRERPAFFLHPGTGACYGRDQLEQVRVFGLVRGHHPAMRAVPARQLLAGAE